MPTACHLPSIIHTICNRYILRRLDRFVLALVDVSIITFALAQRVPMDPAVAALGQNARKEQIQVFRRQYGLDQPPPQNCNIH